MNICDVPGILVGQVVKESENTGCTVVLCKNGAVAGVDIRGSAPGTRETVLLKPGYLIRKIHAVVLTGGSAFGLRAADGVMDYLREQNIGYNANGVIVPIVPAAVIFDLNSHRNPAYPSRDMGYEAARNAVKKLQEGRTGAGRGATVGKILGMENCMAGGVGSCAAELPGGVRVGALAVVNALGDVLQPGSDRILAGARLPDGSGFADSYQVLKSGKIPGLQSNSNTTLVVAATDASFSKEEINKVARMAQNGVARALRPAHTMYDGDIVFALSTGDRPADVNLVGETAAILTSEAITRAVKIANGLQ